MSSDPGRYRPHRVGREIDADLRRRREEAALQLGRRLSERRRAAAGRDVPPPSGAPPRATPRLPPSATARRRPVRPEPSGSDGVPIAALLFIGLTVLVGVAAFVRWLI